MAYLLSSDGGKNDGRAVISRYALNRLKRKRPDPPVVHVNTTFAVADGDGPPRVM